MSVKLQAYRRITEHLKSGRISITTKNKKLITEIAQFKHGRK